MADDYFSRALRFDGGDEVAAELVQQPINRPAPIERPSPIQRPGEVAPRVRAQAPARPSSERPAPAVPQGQGGDYFSRALREDKEPAPVTPQSSPSVQRDPAAAPEPDAPTWMGRRWQEVVGKQDKRFSGLPTIAEALKAEGNLGPGTAGKEMWGWLTGASDNDMGGVYQSVLGDRFVKTETDANGYPIVVYKGKDGQEARAYVNKPGLDAQDVMRGVVGIAPNVGAGRLVSGAMKGSALLPRMVGQAMGQGAASVAQDAAGVATGVSDLNIEKSAEKGLLSAAGGAAGEMVGAAAGAIWRKFVTEPKYYNQATGKLTQEGMAAAERAGVDPAYMTQQIQKQFAGNMAKGARETAAARDAVSNEFNISRTAGEIEGNTQKLLREQQMTAGNYGKPAEDLMSAFRRSQTQQIENAVRGEIEPGKQGIIGQIAPSRAGQQLGKADLGGNIRANTQSAYQTAEEFENRAWSQVKDFRATEEALMRLEPVVKKKLMGSRIDFIDADLTPTAAKMSRMMEEFQAGGAPKSASKYIDEALPGKVDLMRRQLFNAYKTAENGTDTRAAKALYDGFNDWIVHAARMSGDPTMATTMRSARALSRQIHEVFEGKQGTAGANVLANILKKSDSAEGVIDALFSGQTRSNIKSGSIDALGNLKTAYRKFLEPDVAQAAVEDLKLAYMKRAVEDAGGKLKEPRALASALRNMLGSQRSVLNALEITAEQQATIGRLASILEDVSKRNPNTSWSGVSMAGFMKDIGNALLTMIGGNSLVGRAASGVILKPLQDQYGKAMVRQATGSGQGARLVPALPNPPFAGPAGAMAGSDRQ